MRPKIEKGLSASIDRQLVIELLDAHEEIKKNLYLGGHRLSEVEGGRFSEAAFRVLEWVTSGSCTPLSHQVDVNRLIQQLSNLRIGSFPDSIRLHIPRALRIIYDVRSNRDAAHLADGISANIQDSSLVAGAADWVLAEFVRLYHSVPPDEAQRIVDDLVRRSAPSVEDFDGFLKILNSELSVSERCLVLLYQVGSVGATYSNLSDWSRPRSRTNLRRTLKILYDDKGFVHADGENYKITRSGRLYVERNHLLNLS